MSVAIRYPATVLQPEQRMVLSLALAISLLGACSDSSTQRTDLRRPSLLEAVTVEGDDTEIRLQAISFGKSDDSVWLSGTGGSYLAQVSDGVDERPWVLHHFDEPELEFRDVFAFSSEAAVLLAAGTGSASRLYRTDDGGEHWISTWRGEDPEDEGGDAVFIDCVDFWDASRGLVYGDSMGGELFALETEDGGRSWQRVDSLPAAQDGEGGFAASGDCVRTVADGFVGIVTGAGEEPRLLLSSDYGGSWSSAVLPLPGGSSGGAFALALAPSEPAQNRIFVAGGDLSQTDERQSNVVVSDDGGKSWTQLAVLPFPGPAYGLAADYSLGSGREVLLVVGPGGVARSLDGGATFESWTDAEHWAVAFSERGQGLMVGPRARVTRFLLTP